MQSTGPPQRPVAATPVLFPSGIGEPEEPPDCAENASEAPPATVLLLSKPLRGVKEKVAERLTRPPAGAGVAGPRRTVGPAEPFRIGPLSGTPGSQLDASRDGAAASSRSPARFRRACSRRCRTTSTTAGITEITMIASTTREKLFFTNSRLPK